MTTTTNFIDVYSINDAEDSDPDPIYYAIANTTDELRAGLIDALGNVHLELLFNDADAGQDVYNVRNADNDVIAVAYIGNN
ncbi:hypothetical protein [Mycobacterium marinum]|uniref:hypothetical protein n=1 Tax=Mycobacterium marinum TaxID=1781 RepID=UPI000B961574|nr:hypothetical protein [Mycobacterium marinum]